MSLWSALVLPAWLLPFMQRPKGWPLLSSKPRHLGVKPALRR